MFFISNIFFVTESHIRKKKDWSQQDYYDSDEDDFLDRTGDIQKKRRKRMEEDDTIGGPVVTYESLVNSYFLYNLDFS